MFATLFSVALFIALARTVVAESTLSVDTPTLVQCQAAQITWTESGSPPYDLLLVSADDMCGPALEDLGNQSSSATTWTVNVPAGAQVVFYLEDANGNDAWSGTTTVGNSSDTSCLASSLSESAPPASGTTLAASSPTPSVLNPAGAANAGLGSTSGALLARPLSTVALFGSAILLAFTL